MTRKPAHEGATTVRKGAKPARKRVKAALTAKTADKLELYERSVQAPDAEVRFIDRVYRKRNGKPALVLREDFCGTAYMCAEWVSTRPDRTALGLDLHAPTLSWGYQHHLVPLGEAGKRVQLQLRNVLERGPERVDIALALNFSYCVFQTRELLLRYLKAARSSLKPGGMFMLDLYGGPNAQEELEESKRLGGFTYVWEQRYFDAVSARGIRYIHFRFPDGSKLERAFRYDWRIWTLPEVRELLEEAGFTDTEIYWEGADAKGRGNGVFRKVTQAQNEEAWIAYVVAWR